MKICPTCQQQFPNGFQYCPTDTDLLVTAEEYLRRTRPIARPVEPAAAPQSPVAQLPVAQLVEHIRTQPVEPPQIVPQTATVPLPPPTAQTREIPRPAPVAQQPRVAAPPPTNGRTNTVPPVNRGVQNAGQIAAQNGGQNYPQNSTPARPMAASHELSFSVPEAGSLLSRLTGALSNISEAFKRSAPLAPGATGDFTFLLKDESLASRIGREFGSAASDFKRDPKAFVVETIKGEGANKMRQRWILNSAAMAVIVYSLFFFVGPTLWILWFGNQLAIAKEEEAPLEKLAALTETPKVEIKEKAAKTHLGGSKPTPKQASGGGGGGRQQPTPPSKGVPPQMALTPQIIMPNPEPPKIKNPTLVIASTVYGDPKAMPPQKGPIGDPLGVPAPPSSGPGKGAGIGTGEGTGVGRGGGGGVGAGQGGNVGGGDMGLGGGRSGIDTMGTNGSGRPTILYKEKAKYTEDARQNKVQGTVVLNVVFTSDGRITQVRVIRGLPDGLTEKAIEAAQRIRFQPATKNGGPVSVRGNLEFSFNLY